MDRSKESPIRSLAMGKEFRGGVLVKPMLDNTPVSGEVIAVFVAELSPQTGNIVFHISASGMAFNFTKGDGVGPSG